MVSSTWKNLHPSYLGFDFTNVFMGRTRRLRCNPKRRRKRKKNQKNLHKNLHDLERQPHTQQVERSWPSTSNPNIICDSTPPSSLAFILRTPNQILTLRSTMASIATFLSRIPSSLPSSSSKLNPSPSSSAFLFLSRKTRPRPPLRPPTLSPRATAATSGTRQPSVGGDERVQQVRTIDEFDAALRSAKNKLVVVEYAASHSPNSRRIYPCMVELSRTCSDVVFLLVMGDESDETRALCQREGIDKVPHFTFYKGMEKVHEEEGIGPEELLGDVLYYGDSHSRVVQLHCRQDVEALIDKHRGAEGKLVVLDVGLKHCGPCVKVYPTVIKLSRSMAGTVVFGRMNGDENDSCMEFLKDMGVVEVPTFLFLRDGNLCGRYVGSGKGELIGEILRYQGVRVTY